MKTKSIDKQINGNKRFVIINEETGELLDDAQGYGYKTVESSNKAMWYKFQDGKLKLDTQRDESRKFFKDNPEILNYINLTYETHFNQTAFGQIYNPELLDMVEKKFGIKIPIHYMKYPY